MPLDYWPLLAMCGIHAEAVATRAGSKIELAFVEAPNLLKPILKPVTFHHDGLATPVSHRICTLLEHREIEMAIQICAR
jgi:hypothetical protein